MYRSTRVSRALLALTLALLLWGAAAASAAAPWRAAQETQTAVVEAQTALLLDDAGRGNGEAARALSRARAAFAATLAPEFPRELRREARAALRAADRALESGDSVALAESAGRLRATVLRGSYLATLAAVRARDAASAREWLLVREFRKATRFTRPGVDATLAVRELARGELGPRAAALAVKKDLLDAYQARLSSDLDESEEAAGRGFDARAAETVARAAGLWKLLAPEYERSRGAAAREQADAVFERGDIEGARRVLDGFVAAPFTPEEQARRAAQLVRFLDLIPIEYRDGTDDGRVTIPFELQEAVAFHEGAESAFSDLEAELTERDARATAEVEAALAELGGYAQAAASGGEVVEEDEVEAAHERASERLDELFPEEWKEDDSQSDFDLIDLTLDRMEAAIAAGEYRQAEQARLEAYAFFEFGPELSLRSIAPDVVARVEALVWFGYDGLDGLAKLIADERPARDVRATRLALDEALEEGAGTLGEGASTATVVTNAAVIVFREGLEAVLILAAVMASLLGAARGRRKPMLIGAGLAIVASAITFVLAQTVLTSLAQYGEKLEAIVGIVAIGVLLLVLNWFFHRVYWTEHISRFHKRRKRLLALEGGIISAQVLGFVLLGFSTVYREGFETVLFLQALELSSGLWVVLEGVALGAAGVAAVAIVTFALERKLPYKKMLIVTGVLLTIVLAIMVGKTARTMQGVGWLPITPVDLDVPYWAGLWLGIFPTVETLAAQVASVAFVIGSYLLAERLRKPRSGSSAAKATEEVPDATAWSEEGHEEGAPVRARQEEPERAGTL